MPCPPLHLPAPTPYLADLPHSLPCRPAHAYTCRRPRLPTTLSAAGIAAVKANRANAAGVPLALVNGTAHYDVTVTRNGNYYKCVIPVAVIKLMEDRGWDPKAKKEASITHSDRDGYALSTKPKGSSPTVAMQLHKAGWRLVQRPETA